MPVTAGITIGDINGIGPEIILKTLSENNPDKVTPLIISPPEAINFYQDEYGYDLNLNIISDSDKILNGKINLLKIPGDITITPGIQSAESGRYAMKSIDKAIQLCLNRTVDCMITAPISKEAVNLAGYHIPGHTEYLADKTQTDDVLMMLVNDGLRVALVTTHVPVKDIDRHINRDSIISKARIMDRSLRLDFGIKEPRIAVFGLNPHAGDGGVIGNEEIEIIKPTIKHIQGMGINAEGPFPADGFFGQSKHKEYDGILAMYHDQGLVPFKLLSFGSGVNFTAGLPIIRTSPDHGTAFNIAGKGKADPSSFKLAYDLAVKLAEIRKSL